MPALEILQLRLAPGVSPNDPSLLQSFIKVRTALRERVHNTDSRCYQCIEDETLIYVFGIWPDLATHEAFLNSPLKTEIVALQEGQTTLNWMVHIEIDDINSLPFDAPVLGVTVSHLLPSAHVTEMNEAIEMVKTEIVEATKPYNVVQAWRSDADTGKQELIVISGWQSVERELEFRNKMETHIANFARGEHFEVFAVHHTRNMER